MKKEEYQKEPFDDKICIICGFDICVCEPEVCDVCGGFGEYTCCPDDLCQGDYGCIHGDNFICSNCDGEGVVYPRRVTSKEYEGIQQIRKRTKGR